MAGSSNRKVDFFIVGAMRSGTSSIRDWFANDPRVNMAKGEPMFFSNDRLYRGGLDKYHELFDWESEYVLRGEKSPRYAVIKHTPGRVYEYNPDAKIVWMLRDPAERAISHAAHSRYRTEEALPLKYAIENRDQLEADQSSMAYVYRSQYEKQLTNWLQYFSLERQHIMILEEVIQDQEQHLGLMYDFLGLDKPENFSFPHTQRPGVTKVKKENPVDDGTRRELNRILKPTVDWVEKLLGRSIPEWSN